MDIEDEDGDDSVNVMENEKAADSTQLNPVPESRLSSCGTWQVYSSILYPEIETDLSADTSRRRMNISLI
ncbi:hypothetical protein PM082_019951 [Marasmius tenuissimus]|nr:hypothetical protein PM082_019951 [Marasmius tenuissimus]